MFLKLLLVERKNYFCEKTQFKYDKHDRTNSRESHFNRASLTALDCTTLSSLTACAL